MRKRGNVLLSVLILCMILGAFSLLMCRYSLRIMRENRKNEIIQDEVLKRERLECEVKGRWMYSFYTYDSLEKKIKGFKTLMDDLGLKPYEACALENNRREIRFRDKGICDIKVEIQMTSDEKIEKFRVEVINF